MSVTAVCYCTREQVKRAPDLKDAARIDAQIDRAIQSAARGIEGLLNRRFYPEDATRYFEWPNFQYAYPWRIWFDQWELAATPTSVSSGGVTIPISACNFEPVNSGPPFTYLELRRDLPYSFGVGPTPQRDVAITGTWGYGTSTDAAGTLATAISSTTGTSVTVSDGSLVGVGDLLIVDSERMLVTNRASTDSGQTVLSGLSTASPSDNAATVTDGTQLHIDEVIQVDSERMLITDITGNTVTVKRAWDGTILAAHSPGARIYAFRTLTVARGRLGTTAATHSNGTAAAIHHVPSLVRDLAVAEAVTRVLQEIAGYARTVRTEAVSGNTTAPASTAALNDLRNQALTTYGRKARQRVV